MLGIQDVIWTRDASKETIEVAFKEVQQKFSQVTEDESHYLYCSVYYSGYGMQCGETIILLNEEEQQKRFFQLEARLTRLSSETPNSFISIVFDACRQIVTKDSMQKKGVVIKELPAGKNMHFTYGCEPSQKIDLDA